jgi:hypothetical protein
MPAEPAAARVAIHGACAALCFFAACSAPRADANPMFAFDSDTASPAYGTTDVLHIDRALLRALVKHPPADEEWSRIFAVFTAADAASARDALPVLGRYQVTDDRLRFTFRFPPVPGQPYYARFDESALRIHAGLTESAADAALPDTTFVVPSTGASRTTTVTAVYPSADVVPVNLLRIYVHFSAPMRMGEAYRRVRVLDEGGNVVADAFLVVDQELWDPERRRLTLLFDPGRIKRGLRPHEEAGLPLRERGSYTLIIDGDWPDANGAPLRNGHEKQFRVVAADRASPRPAEWTVRAPSAGTRTPLTIDFPESLDHALLERVLVVKDNRDRVVAGNVAIEASETRWSFIPDAVWQPQNYRIEIGTELEDLAGNNLRRLFDRTHDGDNVPADSLRVNIPFVVRPD